MAQIGDDSPQREAPHAPQAQRQRHAGPQPEQQGTPPRLLFLDVDGVLNTEDNPRGLDAVLLGRLRGVLRATGARLVLSTMWRLHPRLKATLLAGLEAAQIPTSLVLGQTENLGRDKTRAHEIGAWLESHPHAQWIAVDDIDLEAQHASLLAGHFVHTSPSEGLTADLASLAIRLLGDSLPEGDGRAPASGAAPADTA